MSKNSEIIEDFKKSLSATIKSIGKKEDIEINFVKENPSIIGNTINLTEPKIENFKNNLEYLRALKYSKLFLKFSIFGSVRFIVLPIIEGFSLTKLISISSFFPIDFIVALNDFLKSSIISLFFDINYFGISNINSK